MALSVVFNEVALGEARADEALEQCLVDLVGEVRATHGGFRVDDEGFVKFLAERVEVVDDAKAALEKLTAIDLWVAYGCLESDRAALDVFDRQYLSIVAPAVCRIDPSEAFADEVKQHMRVSLLLPREGHPQRLSTYRGVGKLTSWIKVGAVRAALELRRKRRPQDIRTDDALMDAQDLDDDPELSHIRQMYRSEFGDAFKESLAELTSRERNILRMYLMEGLNIEQIGTVYRVHRATVARWIAKSRDQLLMSTRKKLVKKLNLTQTQFESLMVVVRSHLDLSIERFLTTKSVDQESEAHGGGRSSD